MRAFSGTLLRRMFFSFSLVSGPLSLGLLATIYLVEDFSQLSRSTVNTLTLVLASGKELENSVQELEIRLRENLLLGRHRHRRTSLLQDSQSSQFSCLCSNVGVSDSAFRRSKVLSSN